MDPLTSKRFKEISKRLDFKRKEERKHLPLLVVRFDGVLGTFQREELLSDSYSFYLRQKFIDFKRILYPYFQLVLLIDLKMQEKCEKIK